MDKCPYCGEPVSAAQTPECVSIGFECGTVISPSGTVEQRWACRLLAARAEEIETLKRNEAELRQAAHDACMELSEALQENERLTARLEAVRAALPETDREALRLLVENIYEEGCWLAAVRKALEVKP